MVYRLIVEHHFVHDPFSGPLAVSQNPLGFPLRQRPGIQFRHVASLDTDARANWMLGDGEVRTGLRWFARGFVVERYRRRSEPDLHESILHIHDRCSILRRHGAFGAVLLAQFGKRQDAGRFPWEFVRRCGAICAPVCRVFADVLRGGARCNGKVFTALDIAEGIGGVGYTLATWGGSLSLVPSCFRGEPPMEHLLLQWNVYMV